MARKRRLQVPTGLIAALAILGCVAPAAADPSAAGMQQLAAVDLRVAAIGYRLATAGRDYCPHTFTRLPGWVIGDAAQYAPEMRPAAMQLLGLGAGETVVALVPGAAAEQAGVRSGDVIVAINGTPLPAKPVGLGSGASYGPLGAALDALRAAFSEGPVRLDLSRGSQRISLVVAGAMGCRSLFQIELSGVVRAGADGKVVSITTAMANLARSDDELAFVLAHELSHNILGHRVMLDQAGVPTGLLRGFGKNAARVRRTELEADYLGLYLVARTGYELAAAPAFWTRYASAHGEGLMIDPTHPGTRDRIAFIERGIVEIRLKQARGEPLTPNLGGLPAEDR